MFEWDSDPRDVLAELKMRPNIVSYDSVHAAVEYLSELRDNKRFALVVGNCADAFMSESPELWGKTTAINEKYPHIVRQVDPLSVMIRTITTVRDTVRDLDLDQEFALFLRHSNFFKPRSDSGRVFRGSGVNRSDDLTYDPERMLQAYNETAYRILHTQNWGQDARTIMRVWHASEYLQMDYERATTRKVGYNMSQAGTAHMKWIGARSAKIGNGRDMFYPASDCYQPFAVKVTHDMSKLCMAYVTKWLDRSRWKKPMIFVSRLGVDHMHMLPMYIQWSQELQKRYRLTDVLWMVDPQHGNTTKFDDGTKHRPYRFVQDEMMHFLETCDYMNVHPAGLWLEANFTESGKDPQDPDSLCDPRLPTDHTVELLQSWTIEFQEIMTGRQS